MPRQIDLTVGDTLLISNDDIYLIVSRRDVRALTGTAGLDARS